MDPKDLMSRIKQIKSAETSCNPNSVIGELSGLIYKPSRESAAEFNSKFDELVQKRNNIELIPKMSDAECRFMYFNATAKNCSMIKGPF